MSTSGSNSTTAASGKKKTLDRVTRHGSKDTREDELLPVPIPVDEKAFTK